MARVSGKAIGTGIRGAAGTALRACRIPEDILAMNISSATADTSACSLIQDLVLSTISL